MRGFAGRLGLALARVYLRKRIGAYAYDLLEQLVIEMLGNGKLSGDEKREWVKRRLADEYAALHASTRDLDLAIQLILEARK